MAEEMYLPYDRGGFLRKVDAFPAGYSNDGIFGYIIDGVKYIRTRKGPVNSMEVGIYANGSDMTARINTVALHPWVKKIEFSQDAGGDIICTGNVNGQGKVFEWHAGTTLKTTGSGVVSNFIIKADDHAQIFTGTKNFNPLGSSSPYNSVNWWGANNGVDENGAVATKAATTILFNPSMSRTLFFPDKTYNCSTPVILANYNAGYQQTYIELLGNDNSNLSAIATTLAFSNANGFGIGIQVGKGVVIRGLKIKGAFVRNFGTDMKAFVETKLANYSTGTGCRDTRYSPHCGIIIDPFCGSTPPDGGYPGLTSYYQGGVTVEGSTAIKIEHCAITNWVLGVGVSINGTTLNCDSCVIQHCSIEHNKVDLAYGQDQTKRCLVADIMVSDSIHTFVTTRMYGTGTGAPPDIEGVTIASKCNQIFDVDTAGRFGFECNKIYAESTYRIGMIVGKPTVIKNLKFNASLAEYPGILGAPDLYGQFNNVTFEGGLIRNYDNLNNKRMHFYAADCTFKKVQFDKPPLFQEGGNNTFEACSCDDGHTITSGDLEVLNDYEIANLLQHGRIRVKIKQNFTYAETIREYNFTRDYETRILASNGAVLTVNPTNRTATFPTGDEINYAQVGDYIYKLTPGNFFDYATQMPFEVVGRITSMSGGVTSLADVPVEIVSGNYNLYMSFFRPIGIPFVADTTNGNPVMTNVEASGYSFPFVGMRITMLQFGIMGNVYVKAANFGAKTVTLSAAPFVALKNVEFNDYLKTTIRSALHPAHPNYVNATSIIFSGTTFTGFNVDDDGAIYLQEYECIKPGFISASAAAVVTSSRIAKWGYRHTDIFTKSADFSRTIEAGVSYEVTIKPTADMTLSIGTTPGGNDVADAVPLTAGKTEIVVSPNAADVFTTLYFTGISAVVGGASVDGRITKKSL